MDSLSKLGVRWVRDTVLWDQMETAAGPVYRFPEGVSRAPRFLQRSQHRD